MMSDIRWDDLEEDLGSSVSADSPDDLKQIVDEAANMGHWEVCPKCHGTKVFRGYSGRVVGPCRACAGKGGKHYKTDSATRAKSREQRATREMQRIRANQDAVKAAHPDEYQYLLDRVLRWDFARSLIEQAQKRGEWTVNQVAAVQRFMARDAEREEAKVEIDLTKIEELFARAKERGLNRRALRFALDEKAVKLTPSPNKPAIWVTVDGQFVGGIRDGKFSAKGPQPDGLVELLKKVAEDPENMARLYGQRTGVCCCCGLELTNHESIRLGIGPICRSKYF